MNWINVATRVPDNRRDVLAWGDLNVMGYRGGKARFLGVTRFNPGAWGGRGEFDCEPPGHGAFVFVARRVTHWAEIEGPTP